MKYLWLAGVAFALALGVKATMLLVLPSLLLVAIFALRARAGEPAAIRWQRLGVGALGCCLALAVITLPAGYAENLLRFGNPLGPKSVREEHTIEGKGLPAFLKNGGLNLLRYGFDFLALDGVVDSPLAHRLQRGMTLLPRRVLPRLGINLPSMDTSRRQFSFEREYSANENCSYWGVLGVLLVWPVVLLTLCGGNQSPGMRIFALATVVFFVVQAFASPYDPWRGRYFMTAALFAAPTLGAVAFPRRLLGKCYLTLVVTLGCLLAMLTVLAHNGTLVFPMKAGGKWLPSTFATGRAAQLTREMRELQRMLLLYEDFVPEHTVVATDITPISYEYLFFGDRLSRRLIPLRPFIGAVQPLPADAQYLLYSADSRYARKGDPLICYQHPYCGTLYVRQLK